MTPVQGSADAPGPLAGVRVIEVSSGAAGRMAGMLLADLGAEVMRVLAPGTTPYDEADPAEVSWDRGKRRVEMNDDDVRGLAAETDVFLVNLVPSELRDRRLGRVDVQAPATVHVWLPPYAETGEWCDLPDDPLFLAALATLAVHLPADDDSPVAPVVSSLSAIHGAIGAAAAIAGLIGRARSGLAQPVVVTGLHAAAALMGTAFTEIDDQPSFAPSRAIVPAPNWRTYECSDGKRIFLATLTPHLFFRALEALGRLDVMVLPEVGGEFTNVLDVHKGRLAVAAELEPVFATRSSQEWLELLARFRVPCAPVQTRDEWFSGPVVAANEARVVLEHEQLGPVSVPNAPLQFSTTPVRVRALARTVPARSASWAAREHETSPQRPGQPPAMPLAGLRVLDMSSFFAAPLASALLADFGADVVRVEPPGGDTYRNYVLSFLAVNQRKRGIELGLAEPSSGPVLHRLLEHMDVLVENVRPNTRERLGLVDTADRFPRLVHCSVSAFGRAEAWADTPGFDPLFQSMSGMARAQGGDGPPIVGSAGVTDAGTGALAAVGVLAALYARERSGRGQQVWASLAVTSTYLQTAEFTTWTGSPPPRRGHELYRGPDEGHRYHQCRDGWVAVAAVGATATKGLCTALGVSGLADVGRALAARPVREAVQTLAEAGVPVCRVVARPRPLVDPFLEENGFTHLVPTPYGVARIVDRHSRWPAVAADPPARYFDAGQDTDEVLAEFGIAPEAAR